MDVLLSLWSYLDDESRGTLVRERPPSAPALLAAYRWARDAAGAAPEAAPGATTGGAPPAPGREQTA